MYACACLRNKKRVSFRRVALSNQYRLAIIPRIKCDSYWKTTAVSLFLLSDDGVVNFSEEVLFFISVSVFRKVQGKDGPVNNEQDSQETGIVNSEPFVGTVGGDSRYTGENSGDGSSYRCDDTLLQFRGLRCHGQRSGGSTGYKKVEQAKKRSVSNVKFDHKVEQESRSERGPPKSLRR